MVRRAAKVDGNHGELVDALRDLGWWIRDVHSLPGFVDAVGYRSSHGLQLFEFKRNEKAKLKPSQQAIKDAGVPLVRLNSVDDAIWYTRGRRALLVLCALLFAATVEAGPIQFTHSGCVTALPEGASWVGEDFLFMVYTDPKAGCEPTTFANTLGLHIESTNPDGLFRVDVPTFLIAGGCGRYQFDAHVRIPGGLSEAPGGLQTLVVNTGVDCAPSHYIPRQPEPPLSVPDGASSGFLFGFSVLLCAISRAFSGKIAVRSKCY